MIVRGISDMLTDKTARNDSVCQALAARHAAAFTFEVLDGLTVSAGSSDTASRLDRIPSADLVSPCIHG